MTCPDCGGSVFLEGPHGGLSVNFCCANRSCRACFNDGLEITRHGRVEPNELGRSFHGRYEPGQWLKEWLERHQQ